MRTAVLSGAATMVVQVAQTRVDSIVSRDKLVEILLSLLVALAVYIAKQIHRHSLYLFGGLSGDSDKGAAGDIRKLQQDMADVRRALSLDDEPEVVPRPHPPAGSTARRHRRGGRS